MMKKKTYWKGIEELENSNNFQERASKEFPEYLPINTNNSSDSGTNRRDFLKMMGFSLAAATVASCETPIRKAIPYVNKPVDVDPGIANYYASSYTMGNDYCSVIVKTREGRPIKIEPNNLSKVSGGGTTTRAEASILSLYDDEARIKKPLLDGKDTNWKKIDDKVKQFLSDSNKKVTIVSYSNCSPSTKKAFDLLSAKHTNLNWIQYDPVSYSCLLDAYEKTTGERRFPLHDFSTAETIVSFGADFLTSWPNQAGVNKQFASTRKLGEYKRDISRLYCLESNLSITGASADVRIPLKTSDMVMYLANLYNLIAVKGNNNSTIGVETIKDIEVLRNVADDLYKSKGKALVVCGINDLNAQLITVAINNLLSSFGSTIDLSKSVNIRQGNDKEISQLIDDAKNGNLDGVIFYNCNPLYDHPHAKPLKQVLTNLTFSLSTSNTLDETASQCKIVAPDHHFLESWNDMEPITGQFSFSQPTISPLFDTRQVQDSFLKWADAEGSYYDLLKKVWEDKGVESWEQCLHDGVFEEKATSQTKNPVTPAVDVVNLSQSSTNTPNSKDSFELITYENNSVGDGIQANNPWLQEMPDPITKTCWDNYLTVSPKEAVKNGWIVKDGDMEFKVAQLTVNGITEKLALIPQPGQAEGTIGLALGYGRTNSGKVANNRGVSAYRFLNLNQNFVKNASLNLTEETKKIAQTQTSQTFNNRNTIIQETTLKEYKKDPYAGRQFPEISSIEGKRKPSSVTIWKGHEYPNHHWGMSIDLNSCTGCGTCTIACQVENNIPVVGKQEVLNRREMHWIRIDRYYSSDEENIEKSSENPEVTFQPMMCQHCNNAPCETVCPVAATTHSTEGLNMMAYNRCVGTRYCANNCPYKVRRFNWFKYHDNEQFADNTSMNNDLGKMVLNPDVTVRSRGVMEKCSFCVQRIQEGKLTAKKERRPIADGEIQTACAKACPADAITFGDMKDSKSKIARTLNLKEEDNTVEAQEPRAYHVLEELRVMPNVWYLTRVRNKTTKGKSKV